MRKSAPSWRPWPPRGRLSKSSQAQRKPCAAKPIVFKHPPQPSWTPAEPAETGPRHSISRPRRPSLWPGVVLTVAKHGNRSVSSQCGSADLLEKLGVKLDTAPEIVEEAVQEIGIGFLFAPLYHSAMRFAAKARMEVGLRSIFNMLGPAYQPGRRQLPAAGCLRPGVDRDVCSSTTIAGRPPCLCGSRS